MMLEISRYNHFLIFQTSRLPNGSPWRSVELATGFKCPLRGAAVNFQARLHPGKNVAHLGFAAARCQIVYLPDGQFAIPDVEIRQIPDESLRGIEPSSEHVLW